MNVEYIFTDSSYSSDEIVDFTSIDLYPVVERLDTIINVSVFIVLVLSVVLSSLVFRQFRK